MWIYRTLEQLLWWDTFDLQAFQSLLRNVSIDFELIAELIYLSR